MKVEVVPEEYMGDVIGDMNSPWRIEGMESGGGTARVTAMFRCPRCSVTLLTCVPRLRAW